MAMCDLKAKIKRRLGNTPLCLSVSAKILQAKAATKAVKVAGQIEINVNEACRTEVNVRGACRTNRD